MNPQRFNLTIDRPSNVIACDAIADHCGLSKTRVKQAMIKGAVWLKAPGKAMQRIRRATARLAPGDQVVVYYDPDILGQVPPQSRCIEDYGQYGIWFKPSGLMTQGTRFGDHCSLQRQVEQHFQSKRKIYLVHRLDREAAGLVILAHSSKSAALFSRLFRDHNIEKCYMAWLRGNPALGAKSGGIDLNIDGRSASTQFECIRYLQDKDQSLVNIRIHTGRFHQIRRHFDMTGHPVMGDPRYGRNNKNQAGLQLVAYRLRFECPFDRGIIDARIDPEATGLL